MLLPVLASAQISVSGKITDQQTGQSLTGATISINASAMAATVDGLPVQVSVAVPLDQAQFDIADFPRLVLAELQSMEHDVLFVPTDSAHGDVDRVSLRDINNRAGGTLDIEVLQIDSTHVAFVLRYHEGEIDFSPVSLVVRNSQFEARLRAVRVLEGSNSAMPGATNMFDSFALDAFNLDTSTTTGAAASDADAVTETPTQMPIITERVNIAAGGVLPVAEAAGDAQQPVRHASAGFISQIQYAATDFRARRPEMAARRMARV